MSRSRSKISGLSATGEHDLVINTFTALPNRPHDLIRCPALGEPGFALAGHRWRVLLYPGGYDEQTAGWVSVFLEYDGAVLAPRRASALGEPVRAIFSFALLNTSGLAVKRMRSAETRFAAAGANYGFASFAHRSAVLAACHDDSALLRLGVRVLGGVDACEYAAHGPAGSREVQHAALRADMRELLGGACPADVCFVVGESAARMPAHRAVVCARSRVLRAELASAFREGRTGEVRVPDADEGSFGLFLEFLYAGEVSVDTDGAPADVWLHLAVLADRYDVGSLAALCEDRLTEGLCEERVGDVLALADRVHAQMLRANCLAWVARRPHVAEAEQFREAVGERLHEEVLAFIARPLSPATTPPPAAAAAAAEEPPAKRPRGTS
eukprot:m51a1_g10314 hypothetical protein (384) ;mRNA; f:2090-3458